MNHLHEIFLCRQYHEVNELRSEVERLQKATPASSATKSIGEVNSALEDLEAEKRLHEQVIVIAYAGLTLSTVLLWNIGQEVPL